MKLVKPPHKTDMNPQFLGPCKGQTQQTRDRQLLKLVKGCTPKPEKVMAHREEAHGRVRDSSYKGNLHFQKLESKEKEREEWGRQIASLF